MSTTVKAWSFVGVAAVILAVVYGLVSIGVEPQHVYKESDLVSAAGFDASKPLPLVIGSTPVYRPGTVSMLPKPITASRGYLLYDGTETTSAEAVTSFVVPIGDKFYTWNIPTERVSVQTVPGARPQVQFVLNHSNLEWVGMRDGAWYDIFAPKLKQPPNILTATNVGERLGDQYGLLANVVEHVNVSVAFPLP